MQDLKDIIVILFIVLGCYLTYKLFNCSQNSWLRKHRGLYGFLTLGILQFPIVVLPIGYFNNYKSPLAWLLLYLASFGIFVPLYLKFNRTCQKPEDIPDESEDVETDKKYFLVHCPVCGNDDEIPISDNTSEIGCRVCGRVIPKSECTELSITKCPCCSKQILWNTFQKLHRVCPSCGHVLVPPDGI